MTDMDSGGSHGNLEFHGCFISLVSAMIFVLVLDHVPDFCIGVRRKAEFSDLVCANRNMEILRGYFPSDYFKS